LHAASKAFFGLCLAVLGLAVVSVAQADRGGGGDVPRPVLAAVHADVSISSATGEKKSITWDRGTVSAKSDTSITLTRKDGKTATLRIDANTKTRGAVEQGKPAVVFSNAGTATAILGYRDQRSPATANDRGRGGGPFGIPRGAVHVGWALILPDGKAVSLALDRGEVTAVNSSSITLKRPDNVSVTLKIDAKTKVHAKDGKINVGDKSGVVSQAGTALAILAGPGKSS
jgi:hypothetical protein